MLTLRLKGTHDWRAFRELFETTTLEGGGIGGRLHSVDAHVTKTLPAPVTYLDRVGVTGRLSHGDSSLTELRRILLSSNAIVRVGNLRLSVAIEEAQIAGFFQGILSIWRDETTLSLGYDNVPTTDARSARAKISGLINAAKLPVSIVDTGIGFKLSHDNGGALGPSSVGQKWPTRLRCELSNAELQEGFQTLLQAIEHLGGGETGECRWRAYTAREAHHDANELYGHVVGSDFQADVYEITSNVVPRKIDDVEDARQRFGSFSSDAIWACETETLGRIQFGAEINGKGYQVTVSVRDDVPLAELEKFVGHELRRSI